jgi:hypothetical protein
MVELVQIRVYHRLAVTPYFLLLQVPAVVTLHTTQQADPVAPAVAEAVPHLAVQVRQVKAMQVVAVI